ncbi:MAG TPA: hypothetical protein PKK06_12180 [Phycisphaerae bacterium]|nr:hypothetical protein [Phycisphaerae bacterium]HNU46369.1 hypothetical protein [Phycisphaerae bacterium]
MSKRIRRKLLGALCGACLLGFPGNCVPNNFWYQQYEWTLNAAVQTAISNYVLAPIVDGLG